MATDPRLVRLRLQMIPAAAIATADPTMVPSAWSVIRFANQLADQFLADNPDALDALEPQAGVVPSLEQLVVNASPEDVAKIRAALGRSGRIDPPGSLSLDEVAVLQRAYKALGRDEPGGFSDAIVPRSTHEARVMADLVGRGFLARKTSGATTLVRITAEGMRALGEG